MVRGKPGKSVAAANSDTTRPEMLADPFTFGYPKQQKRPRGLPEDPLTEQLLHQCSLPCDLRRLFLRPLHGRGFTAGADRFQLHRPEWPVGGGTGGGDRTG